MWGKRSPETGNAGLKEQVLCSVLWVSSLPSAFHQGWLIKFAYVWDSIFRNPLSHRYLPHSLISGLFLKLHLHLQFLKSYFSVQSLCGEERYSLLPHPWKNCSNWSRNLGEHQGNIIGGAQSKMEKLGMGLSHRHGLVNTASCRHLSWPWSLAFLQCYNPGRWL